MTADDRAAPDAEGERLAAALEAAERWAIHDPDPVMRSAVDRLVDRRDPSLIGLFDGRLSFGTAGLRAAVGPGPNRMNALVVRQTTVGVMRWLAARPEAAATPTVVIGYDARRDSATFARHVAAAVLAAGGQARLVDAAVPTPVVAHALLAEAADAAVVVTASHNPPADNGYKLYAADGLQIVPPAEQQIAEAIEAAAAAWTSVGVRIDDAFAGVAPNVSAQRWIEAHRVAAVRAAAVETDGVGDQSDVAVVYTPMHGVGGEPTLAAFAQAELAAPVIVENQFRPDPDFPTVDFPNPEEDGALDEALSMAERLGAGLIVAQDPDADRLAVVARDAGGVLRALSGDQLGAVLGDHLLGRLGDAAARALVARSVVSSRRLDAIAADHGATCAVTLTGFKWIARAAFEHPDLHWCFGYEEAIGFAIGDHVRDKDGITAALVIVDLARRLAMSGATLWDRLDELAVRHGVYCSRPVTARFDDAPARVDEVVDALVAAPPRELAGAQVVAAGPIGGGALPTTPGVELHTADRTRVIVRPSGTEPKVKAYLEAIEPVAGTGDLDRARSSAAARVDMLTIEIEQLLRAR